MVLSPEGAGIAALAVLSSACADPDDTSGKPAGGAEPDATSATIKVWTNGSFTVKAGWEVDGYTICSRPYTAVLTPGDPVTPVTCTLEIPTSSGSFGVWSAVQWDPLSEEGGA